MEVSPFKPLNKEVGWDYFSSGLCRKPVIRAAETPSVLRRKDGWGGSQLSPLGRYSFSKSLPNAEVQ